MTTQHSSNNILHNMPTLTILPHTSQKKPPDTVTQ